MFEGFPNSSVGKNLPAMQETLVQELHPRSILFNKIVIFFFFFFLTKL